MFSVGVGVDVDVLFTCGSGVAVFLERWRFKCALALMMQCNHFVATGLWRNIYFFLFYFLFFYICFVWIILKTSLQQLNENETGLETGSVLNLKFKKWWWQKKKIQWKFRIKNKMGYTTQDAVIRDCKHDYNKPDDLA